MDVLDSARYVRAGQGRRPSKGVSGGVCYVGRISANASADPKSSDCKVSLCILGTNARVFRYGKNTRLAESCLTRKKWYRRWESSRDEYQYM
jgi:hypothetical protein